MNKEIYKVAQETLSMLAPHCTRFAIAGSILRRKPDPKDIEIVVTPKPYDTGLFATGIATVVNQWKKVKGELPCKYTQRILPSGYKLDLFIVEEEDDFGWIWFLRTGPTEYNIKIIQALQKKGYEIKGGQVLSRGTPLKIIDDTDVFRLAGIPYLEPWNRGPWKS